MNAFSLGDVFLRRIKHTLRSHSNTQWCSTGLRDIPTLISGAALADDFKMVTWCAQNLRLHSQIMGHSDHFCLADLPHNWTGSPPEIVFFHRWVWHSHPCVQTSKGSKISDRQCILSLRSVHRSCN